MKGKKKESEDIHNRHQTPPKNITMNCNIEIKNIFIMDKLYSSHYKWIAFLCISE